jgi:putative endopeptidase
VNLRSIALAGIALRVAAQAPQPPLPAPARAAPYGTWGVDLGGMDRRVKPGDDFDRFVNGAWADKAVIPSDRPSLSTGSEVYDRTQRQIRTLLDQAPASSQLGAMYQSFMNEAVLERLDDKPLRVDLERLAGITTKDAFMRFMGQTRGGFGASLWRLWVTPDPTHPATSVLALRQAGLTLPDRDYYLSDTFKPQRDAYRAFLERALAAVGYPEPSANAEAILAFETEIAKVSWPKKDRRNLDLTLNPMTPSELQAYAPGLDWSVLLEASGIPKVDRIILNEKTAIRDIATRFASAPLSTLLAWEAAQVIFQASPYLSRRFVDSQFTFTRTLNGVSEPQPRWKRATEFIDDALGELLGHAYTEACFPPSSKTQVVEIVANLKGAMASRLRNSAWMSPQTKAAALEKLARMGVMVGYPDRWQDYSGLKVDPADLYGNVVRAGRFEWACRVAEVGKPVDRSKWDNSPQTVDAYYAEGRNQIVFPAGILQAPFFDARADPAVNYGAIGAIIGHEMCHGFDDQGRKIDAQGTYRDWWTKEDEERYLAQSGGLGRQYDAFEPLPGMHVDGKLTLGETIADMAGLTIAFDAYRASLKGARAPVLDGFTGDQRFFLAFGQVWRGKQREEVTRAQVAGDQHPPQNFRIIGTTRNVDAWYQAFGITGGRYFLLPGERVRIW